MGNTVLIRGGTVTAFTQELFQRAGISELGTKYHAECLINTNYWGTDSHGVIRVPAYFKRMLNGAINTNPQIKMMQGEGCPEVPDTDAATGLTGGRAGMGHTTDRIATGGIAAYGVINSNHFGVGALYARMAVERDMIRIVMTNVRPLIVAPGASVPMTGNDLIAFGIPAYDGLPFVLGISLSVVAGDKLTLMIKRKEKIPVDWATDKDGRSIDDPWTVFDKYLLPMDGHRGLSLPYAVDMLSGLIVGGIFSRDMKSMYVNPEGPNLINHFFIAMDISGIISKERMKECTTQFKGQLKAMPVWQGGAQVLLPGETRYHRGQERCRNSLPAPMTTHKELAEFKKEYDVQTPPTIVRE